MIEPLARLTPPAAPAGPALPHDPPRVLHFVSGGFSGATQVAVTLCAGAIRSGRSRPLLVLRRKPHMPPHRVEALVGQGMAVETVPGWSHLVTILALRRICLRFRPDVLVAHGFSEHLWGRYAALAAGVPRIVMVEHNSRERYTTWRLLQARWLAARTDRIVACGEGVRAELVRRGMPPQRTTTICNGIDVAPFADAASRPLETRIPGIVMAARFARQKDHTTLLHAIALLKDQGFTPPVLLAGGGSDAHRRAAERLAADLGVAGQVRFLGPRSDVPELLMSHQLAVLSSFYEGMPLSVLEAMSAGCAVVGSRVTGVEELVEDGVDGRLVEPGSADHLARAIREQLSDVPLAAAMAERGRRKALERHSIARMADEYEALFEQLAHAGAAAKA